MERNDEQESFYRDTIEDMGSEKYQLEDPMTFWNAEKKAFWKKMLSRSETPFVMMGIGLLIVVAIFFAVYPRGGGGDAALENGALSERLQQIENKINSLETRIEGLTQVQQDMELVKKSVLRFDSSDSAASLRMDRISEDLASLQKEVEEMGSKKTPAAVKAPTPSISQAEKTKAASPSVYYEVRKGDTLYSIGRMYGVSVNAIRKLNGLSEQDAIQPGQKLLVKE